MLRHTVFDEQLAQDKQDIVGSDAARNMARQLLSGVLVDDVEYFDLLAIVRLIADEVIAPDMIIPLWP